MKQIIKLKVNGIEEEKAVHTHHSLLEVLRDEFKLFGAREGCGIGMCGACTVLLDGQPISSCLLLAPLHPPPPAESCSNYRSGTDYRPGRRGSAPPSEQDFPPKGF